MEEKEFFIFQRISIRKKLYCDKLNLSAPAFLPNTSDFPQPFVIMGYETFEFHKKLNKTLSGM